MSKLDMEVLIRCVSSESGYYYPDAYRVAQVILNRCVKKNKSVTEVVYQKKQFSGIGSKLWKSTDKEHLRKLRRICRRVIEGRIPKDLQLDREILYFMNPKTAKGTWAAKMRKVKPVVVSKNNHHYYSE
jgi:spore germination cell wall hydrolase CwlJ-like protein